MLRYAIFIPTLPLVAVIENFTLDAFQNIKINLREELYSLHQLTVKILSANIRPVENYLGFNDVNGFSHDTRRNTVCNNKFY